MAFKSYTLAITYEETRNIDYIKGFSFPRKLVPFDVIRVGDSTCLVTSVDGDTAYVRSKNILFGQETDYILAEKYLSNPLIAEFEINPKKNDPFPSDDENLFSLSKITNMITHKRISICDGVFGEIVLGDRIIFDVYLENYDMFNILTSDDSVKLLEDFEKEYGELKFAWYNN